MESQSLADVLHGLVHELRAPVRALSGFSQALREETYSSLPASCRHYLDRIAENACRLESHSESLTRLARALQPPRVRESFRLAPLLREIRISTLGNSCSIYADDQQLDVDLAGWDPSHVRLLLEALCRYAESLPLNTDLRHVRFQRRSAPGELILEWFLDIENVDPVDASAHQFGQAAIELGIVRAVLSHYPSARLEVHKPWALRLRLGLAAAGHDHSESSDQPMPAAAKTGSHAAPLPPPPATLLRTEQQEPIMFVDDDPAEWELVKLVLEDTGLERALEWYRDSRAALVRLQNIVAGNSEVDLRLPAAIFVDLRMPGLDGVAFVRKLREEAELRHLPAIVLSSSNDPADVRAAYEAGANAFIIKPTDFQCYAECLHSAIVFWTRCNQAAR